MGMSGGGVGGRSRVMTVWIKTSVRVGMGQRGYTGVPASKRSYIWRGPY